jgi:hypothetical protein
MQIGIKLNTKHKSIGNKIIGNLNVGQKGNFNKSHDKSQSVSSPAEIHENVSNGSHVDHIPKGLGNHGKYAPSQQSAIEKKYKGKF